MCTRLSGQKFDCPVAICQKATILNSCTYENALIISQSDWFTFVGLDTMLNTLKSFVISSANEMNSQQDPIKKLNAERMIRSKEKHSMNPKNDCTKNPSGVFALNGHLQERKSKFIFIVEEKS